MYSYYVQKNLIDYNNYKSYFIKNFSLILKLYYKIYNKIFIFN